MRVVHAVIAVIVITVAGDASAGPFGRAARRRRAPQACAAYATPGTRFYAQSYAFSYATPRAASAPSGDPSGFTAWLNAYRAGHGLGPVAYDPGLAGDASVNSSLQNARGLGHHHMGSARRQNSAVGSYSAALAMWQNSHAHNAALLDPTITRAAVAGGGSYWTFSAN